MRRKLIATSVNFTMLMVYDAVCRLENTTRAAEELNISQPAISQYLRKLKDITQVDLFVRSSKGLEPTEEGLEVWKYAKDAMEAVEAIDRFSDKDFHADFYHEKFVPERAEKDFIVAAPFRNVADFLDLITAKTFEEYPQIDINIANLDMQKAYQQMEVHDVDLYVGYISDKMPKFLDYEECADIEFELICASSSPLYSKDIISKEDFTQTLNLRLHSEVHEPALDSALSKAGIMQDEFLNVPNVEGVPMYLRRKQAVFLATRYRAEAMADQNSDIKVLKLDFKIPPIKLYNIWHRIHDQSEAHQWLRKHIRKQINI